MLSVGTQGLVCAIGKCLLPRSTTNLIKTLKTDRSDRDDWCTVCWVLAGSPSLCWEAELRDSRGKGKLELHMSQGARPVGTVRFGGVSWAPPRVLLWFWSWYKPQVTWESRIREQRILPPSIISHGGKYPPHGFKRGAQGHSCSRHRATCWSRSILCSGNRACCCSPVPCACHEIWAFFDILFHCRS